MHFNRPASTSSVSVAGRRRGVSFFNGRILVADWITARHCCSLTSRSRRARSTEATIAKRSA